MDRNGSSGSDALMKVMQDASKRAQYGGRNRKRGRAAMSRSAPAPQQLGVETDGLGLDFTSLVLKHDHDSRPFWVCPNGVIMLEAFSPLYEQARDFLIAICEPKSRPEHLHEYSLDKNALFAAASMGLTSDIILSALNRLSKVPVPRPVKKFVRRCTAGYGKVKLVLHRSRYFVESSFPAVLRYLLSFPDVAAAKVQQPAARGAAGSGSGAAASAGGGTFGDFIVGTVSGETGESLGLEGIVGGKRKGAGGRGQGQGSRGAAGGDFAGDGIVADLTRGEVDTDEEGELEAELLEAMAVQAEEEQAAGAAGNGGPSAAARAQAVSRMLRTAMQRQGSSSMGIDSDELESDEEEDEDEGEAELELGFGAAVAKGKGGKKGKGKGKIKSMTSAASAAGVGVGEDVTSASVSSAAMQDDASTVRSGALSIAGPRSVPSIRLKLGGTGAAQSAAGPKIRLTVKQPPVGVKGGKGGSSRQAQMDAEGDESDELPENVAHLISSSSEDEAAAAGQEDSDDDFDGEAVAMADAGEDDDDAAFEKSLQGSGSGTRRRKGGSIAMDGSDDDYAGEEDEDSDILEIDDDAVDEEEEAEIQEALEALRKGDQGGDTKQRKGKQKSKPKAKPPKKKAAAKGKKKAAAAGYFGGAETEEDLARIKQARLVAMRVMQASEAERRAGGRGPRQVVSFEIRSDKVDQVRKVCLETDPPFPLMLEYDFKEESSAGGGAARTGALSAGVPFLDIDLLRPELLRPYQSRSLAKMFGNGRARSGMIVLPCGAGKTFVGIASAATIKRSCIVLCPNATSVYQWEAQFLKFSKIARSSIMKLTAKDKQPLPPPDRGVLVITTYSMIGMTGRRAEETQAIMRQIAGREWGLMVLDETHQVVARTFSRVLRLKAHCRLGLTATLVREDGKDRDLSYLIGPKLYEANWMDLTRAGYLANVQVVEVWCPMEPAFYREYLRSASSHRKHALAVMNPNKCLALDALLKVHTSRPGDKVIVFSESVFALYQYAVKFQAPIISGDTPIKDREEYLHSFRTSDVVNVLFLSRVGDVALDVPDANVIIQISSHYGSRLQEAQRMGRILRKGSRQSQADAGVHVGGRELFQSYFYTLISTDTHEVYFSNKRRRYLVDQGYAYKVLKLFPGLGNEEELRQGARFMGGDDERMQVLEEVLSKDVDAQEAKEARAFDSVTDGLAVPTGDQAIQSALKGGLGAGSLSKSAAGRAGGAAGSSVSGAVRSGGSMAALSGADGIRYIEYTADERARHLDSGGGREQVKPEAMGWAGYVQPR